ncbi:MAG: fasciclin domain-containing protein [Flavisolibacter sp.]
MRYKILTICCSVVAAFMMMMVVSSCKKTDDTYKNYVNTAGSFNGNALAYLQSQPGVYDSMLLVINRLGGISDTLSKENITLFAVSNRSFDLALQNINQARQDSIPSMTPVSFSTMDSATLDTFLCRYIIVGQQPSKNLVGLTDGSLFPSVRYGYNMQMQLTGTNASGYLNGGPKAIIFSDPKNSVFVRNWIRVNTITVDIKTTNAIVHLLPPGHDFGFGTDFIKSINKR